ncbi:hypothetical protein SISSUDRAFT_1056816 [Sistotremastrum suecicum HHB10207 ss-3]|uniref:FMR1-interacting protein 1 conserved domain-containing protein n=1 Tax=Sistotremastrum suecicum HHB10207 ss-3 TaxID=1314776 RepID=A0A166J818_9AGAM|nr:hypothetical protein SISSUDRAFT_1056816 [Sistotremastrum suecicum HHB10207 ss-3]
MSNNNGPYSQYPMGSRIAHVLQSSLLNPYQNPSPNPVSAHYAQAYQARNAPGHQAALSYTPEGYAISSTYRPSSYDPYARPPPIHNAAPGPSKPNQFNNAPSSQSHWKTPGNVRCAQAGCSFTASAKSVEIHMMDRHLIYPPGWDKRKQKRDWDADPGLIGKPITVFGTNILLNTPEAVDEWIAERKKRWPSKTRVEGKETTKKEALERGEIQMEELRRHGKRRRLDDAQDGGSKHSLGHIGQGRQRGRGRGRGRGSDIQRLQRKPAVLDETTATPSTPIQRVTSQQTQPRAEDTDSSDEEAPEEISSKPLPVQGVTTPDNLPAHTEEPSAPDVVRETKPPPRKVGPHIKSQRNMFSERDSLLRNLLLPEIRHSVSTLSQAIHFLVENDFLEGVELKPGDAESQPIQVIDNAPL